MKKIMSLLSIALICAITIAGCGEKPAADPPPPAAAAAVETVPPEPAAPVEPAGPPSLKGDLTWPVVGQESEGFSVAFPLQPEFLQQKPTREGEAPVYHYSLDVEEALFMAICYDHRKVMTFANEEEAREGLAKWGKMKAASLKAGELTTKSSSLNGAPRLEVTTKTVGPEGEANGVINLVWANGRLYITQSLVVGGEDDEAVRKIVAKFHQSLKISSLKD